MKKLFFTITFIFFAHALQATEIIAVVNDYNITTDVAPKNFSKLDASQKNKITSRLIEKYLATNYALNTDVVNDSKFKKVLNHILKYSPKKGENKTLLKTIKEDGKYTEEQFFSKKGLLAFDFVLEKKMKEMKPDEKILREYYKEHKFKYDTPAKVELASIVVEDEAKAKKIEKELNSSNAKYELFTSLAKKYSKAPEASDGGYIGKVLLHNLNRDIEKRISPLKRGDHTEPINTLFGYEIYYVINNVPEVNTTYEMVKDRVKDDYVHKEVKKWAFDKINKLKESAKITRNF